MFSPPGLLWPQGRVHATFTTDIMGKNVTLLVKSPLKFSMKIGNGKMSHPSLSLTCEVNVVHLGLIALVAAEAARLSSIRRLLRVPEVGRSLEQRRHYLVVGGRVCNGKKQLLFQNFEAVTGVPNQDWGP